MSNLHGILENGNIIKGLDVLAYSYELIGLGWVYYPLKIEFLAPVLRLFYKYWAKYRLKITGRSIIENGEIIRGLDVLAYSYELVGLGWVYYPLKIKFLSPILRLIYRYWAKYRLQITGRSDIEKLCTSQCEQ